jgi:hypothetical protein
MKFNIIELVNVLTVFSLLLVLLRRRDAVTLLLILFVYGTMHFSFAAIALARNESLELLVALHNEGGGVLAKISTLLLLGTVFILLSRHAYDAYLLNQAEKTIIRSFLLVMLAVLCGYVFNMRQGDWLQFKNVISIEATLVLMLLGFLATNGVQAFKIHTWGLAGGLLLLAVTDFVAIYEVSSHSAWSVFGESSGSVIYRASSILFNPNLFGFWASLSYLGCSYAMLAHDGHRKMMLWGMILASVAIYFSGSRSFGYLLLVVLFIPALLSFKRDHWLPLMVLPLTMLSIYGTAWLAIRNISSEGWHEIALLGERFAAAPAYLCNYALMKIGFATSGTPAEIAGVQPEIAGVQPEITGVQPEITGVQPEITGVQPEITVPPEVAIAIEGRYVGEGRDAGWFVLYQDVGWLGMAAILLGCTMLLIWGVRTYYSTRSTASVYALATLCYCALTGLVMRFQIFPVWLFICVALAPCLFYWRQVSVSRTGQLEVNASTNN